MDTNGSLFAFRRFAFEAIPPAEPRVVGLGLIASVGMAIGAVSYLFSIALIPDNVFFPEHDIRLGINLGLIYPPLVGLWASWVRRSVLWAFFGVVFGLVVGAVHHSLSGYDNFLAVAIAIPCLLGGCTSVVLGTKHDSWIAGTPQRFLKGLMAGFVPEIVYFAVLELIFNALAIVGLLPSVVYESTMLWWAGMSAMIVGSGLYFLLLHWSADLFPNSKNRQRTNR